MPRRRQGLRSYHHKSRNGCSNCKRRRVKCSMQAPACANCLRRKETCEYQFSTGGDPASSGQSIPRDKATSPARAGCIDTIPASLGCYSAPSWTSGAADTSSRVSNPLKRSLTLVLAQSWFTPAEQQLWAAAIEEAAAKYTFVGHSFLALSSLMCELNNPAQQIPMLAYQHHLQASALFRQALPSVNEENWIAVISFVVSMVIFHFTTQQASPDVEFDYVQSLKVLRHSKSVEDQIVPFLHKSPFYSLIVERNNSTIPPPSTKLRTNLQKLARLVAQSVEHGDENAETNRKAFWELREWAFVCDRTPRTWRQFINWPGTVSNDFLDLLAKHDDIALLIFIHWCATLLTSPARIHGYWESMQGTMTPPWQLFMNAWSQRASLLATSQLKKDYSEILAWPLSVVLDGAPSIPALVPSSLSSSASTQSTASIPDPMYNVSLPSTPESSIPVFDIPSPEMFDFNDFSVMSCDVPMMSTPEMSMSGFDIPIDPLIL
ncbi:hypothetical protein EJ04DRAFT_466285 [Polyplosphaeria fusca]|uniref:Zn(2)-C6 fungal-type domain-containing protein n=1 Tax=Polyplosphaeria fusca TaxID=682080 RepID=A0A9P4V2V4_9PLEO|nr:hypothetical protein EJ04DRAFT_466285 [Polyplosphaeria fusca]